MLKPSKHSVWGQAARQGNVRISTAGAVHPCLDASMPSGGSKRHQRTSCEGSRLRRPGCYKGVTGVPSSASREGEVPNFAALDFWLDLCAPSMGSQGTQKPPVRVAGFRRPVHWEGVTEISSGHQLGRGKTQLLLLGHCTLGWICTHPAALTNAPRSHLPGLHTQRGPHAEAT